MLAGIEAGGTKFICSLASDPLNILSEARIDTSTPSETLSACLRYFQEAQEQFAGQYGKISSLGIGSFGPLCLNKQSEHYGYISTTPKEGWQYTDLCGFFSERLSVPVAFDTDVNAAAIGEGFAGAGRGLASFIYITVGTGIGVGVITQGKPLHGLLHPEGGHILLAPYTNDSFPGVCPYHGRCLEGLCSGPAIEKRWGTKANNLPPDHEAWDIEAFYLAEAIMSFVLTLSPEQVIVGGGVMHQVQLFPKIRIHLRNLLNNYLRIEQVLEPSENYIVAPSLGDKAGITGALVMAQSQYI